MEARVNTPSSLHLDKAAPAALTLAQELSPTSFQASPHDQPSLSLAISTKVFISLHSWARLPTTTFIAVFRCWWIPLL